MVWNRAASLSTAHTVACSSEMVCGSLPMPAQSQTVCPKSKVLHPFFAWTFSDERDTTANKDPTRDPNRVFFIVDSFLRVVCIGPARRKDQKIVLLSKGVVTSFEPLMFELRLLTATSFHNA
jgi:hypothetical protein